ncbi:MAG TPA: hypothetical protein H9829_09355 [Candidatus Tetragenococcus pullicola]|nr:hypothetical protein [Candidatus Tetragenococcus pullicola]
MENTIVKETLKQKNGFKGKIGYLFFAYKGVIITVVLTILFIISLVFSYISKTSPVLTVRIVSSEETYQNIVDPMKDTYGEVLDISEGESIDVTEFDISDQNNQDAFVAQLVAQQIDVIFVTEEMDQKMKTLFDENQIEKGEIKYTDQYGREFVSRIPSEIPHKESVIKLTNLD